MNMTLLKEYTTEASDGYMGATKTTGSKSQVYLGDAELSKRVEEVRRKSTQRELLNGA